MNSAVSQTHSGLAQRVVVIHGGPVLLKHGPCRPGPPLTTLVAGTGFEQASDGWQHPARPDLWTPEGLAEHLREHGIDPGQPCSHHQDDETMSRQHGKTAEAASLGSA